MEKLQWLFELLDKMSGPSKKITQSLAGVERATAKLRDEKGRFLPGMKKFDSTFASTASSIQASSGIMGDALGTAVGGILKDAVMGAGRLAIAGARWMGDSLAFRENTLISLEAILGSKQAAEDMFKKATAFAAKTPFSSQQVVSAFEKLAAAGFRGDQLEKMMTSVGDFAGTEAAKVDRALLVIAQIKGKGKLQGEELMQLAEMGLPMGKMLEALAKSMGKTTEEVQKLMSAGKITADQGIGALMATIQGTFGGRMEKASNSLTGLWSTLMAAPEDILFAQGDKMNAMIEPIKGLVKKVIAVLSPDSAGGKLLGDMFVRVGNAIGFIADAFGKIDFEKWFGKIGDIIKDLEPKLAAVWAGFSKVFGTGDVAESFGSILETIAWRIKDMDPKTLENLGTALGYVLFGVMKLVQWTIELGVAAGWLIDRIIDLKLWVNSLDEQFAEFIMNADMSSGFRDIGTNALGGFIEGFTSMIPNAIEAVTSFGQSVIDAIDGKLEINSPSMVGFSRGQFFGLGFIGGVDKSGMNDLIAQPIQPSSALGLGAAAGGAGAAPISITVGDVQFLIEGAGKNGEEIAKEAASSFSANLMNALRGISTQAGR